MALSSEDLDFITLVDSKLTRGYTPLEAAIDLGIPPGTLRSRIDRLGYEVQITRRLVPKRAPELDSVIQ